MTILSTFYLDTKLALSLIVSFFLVLALFQYFVFNIKENEFLNFKMIIADYLGPAWVVMIYLSASFCKYYLKAEVGNIEIILNSQIQFFLSGCFSTYQSYSFSLLFCLVLNLTLHYNSNEFESMNFEKTLSSLVYFITANRWLEIDRRKEFTS